MVACRRKRRDRRENSLSPTQTREGLRGDVVRPSTLVTEYLRGQSRLEAPQKLHLADPDCTPEGSSEKESVPASAANRQASMRVRRREEGRPITPGAEKWEQVAILSRLPARVSTEQATGAETRPPQSIALLSPAEMDAQSLATLTPTVQYRSVHVDQNMAEAQEPRFPSLAINEWRRARAEAGRRGARNGGGAGVGGVADEEEQNHRGIYQVETVGE